MQIKLLVPLCGPTGGGSEGDVIEWPDDDAYNIVNVGYAEFVPSIGETAAEFEPLPEIASGVVKELGVSVPVADEAEAKPAKRTRKTK